MKKPQGLSQILSNQGPKLVLNILSQQGPTLDNHSCSQRVKVLLLKSHSTHRVKVSIRSLNLTFQSLLIHNLPRHQASHKILTAVKL